MYQYVQSIALTWFGVKNNPRIHKYLKNKEIVP